MVTKAQRRAHRQKRRYERVSPAQRREIIALAADGKSYRQICDEVDRPFGTVAVVLRPLGGVIRPEDWQPQEGRLGLDDRVEIYLGLRSGQSLRAIATTAERAPVDGVPGSGRQWGPGPLSAGGRSPAGSGSGSATQTDPTGRQR